MKLTKKIGVILLAVYLILSGLTVLIPTLRFDGMAVILAIVAIAAGICLLLDQ